MRFAPRHLLLTLCATSLAATPAAAQYTSPGAGLDAPLNRKDSLEGAWSEARFRLGAVHVEPWFGLRDVAWVDVPDNPQGIDSDLTASVGAGLAAYLRVGDGFIAAKALPEYSYWKDLTDRRRLVGEYGLGYFGFFARGEVELSAERREALAIPTIELLDRVPQTTDELTAKVDFTITGKLGTFVEVRREDFSYDPDEGSGPVGSRTGLLDRQSDSRRAGLRFGDNRWKVGVGLQDEETSFDPGPNDRSNEGTSYLVRLEGKGNRLGFSLEYLERDLEPSGPDSTFVATKLPTGNLSVDLETGWRARWRLYASRSLVYTLVDSADIIEDQRTGLGVTIELGDRSSLLLYGETGSNDYTTGEVVSRTSDLTAYGASYVMQLGRGLTVRLGGSRLKVDGSTPGTDQEVTTFQVGVSFGTAPAGW